MKNKILIFIVLFSLFGLGVALMNCAEFQLAGSRPCILHTGEEFQEFCAASLADPSRTSTICETQSAYGVDFCKAHRMLEIVAKEGVLFEAYTYEEFEAWSDQALRYAKSGISWNDLKFYLITKVAALNQRIGGQLLIMGDLLLYMPPDSIVAGDDIVIVESVIVDLKSEVKKMAVFSK